MGRWVYRLRSSAAFVGLLFVALISLRAQGDETRLAISGYDPVAYFTDGKPTAGLPAFEYQWDDHVWRFVSAEPQLSEQGAVDDEIGIAADRRGEVAVRRAGKARVAEVFRVVAGLLQ